MKIINTLMCKCPECKVGNIFKDKGSILLFQIPKMNKHCAKCDYKFEKETGFFFGAMFVSYTLSAAQMIICLIVFWTFANMSPISVFIIITLIAIFTSTVNFRVSRSIWISFFYKE